MTFWSSEYISQYYYRYYFYNTSTKVLHISPQ